MRPGQTVKRWFQDFQRGLLGPSRLHATARNELGQAELGRFEDQFFAGELPEPSAWVAPQRLQAPGFFLTDRQLTQWDRADWQQTDRRLMRWSALFQEAARKRGIPLYVHSAFRTEAEQNQLMARKVTRAPYPTSAHNVGEAVDIVHGVYHWTMTKQEWAMLHVLGRLCLDKINAPLNKDQKLHLTWGGDFKSLFDPAHWEITDYRDRIERLPVGPPLRLTPRAILRDTKL
ncbi:M15 family metallopeptidase [Szabonella alba]|uniref:M15 family metallopeptidase n=1 Tax=Szabonella alba TaxID=2804194 RepID=A0A8K0VCB5_9RHOB|nr:M15 family metallopeptidase [Szabonella alba]MBL4917255.1 M15 family metallopeptidase [Szabonella alba]